MAGLSCCRVCWAIGGWLRLCGGVWPPSWWGVLWWCVAPLMMGRGVVLRGPPHGGACCGGVWPPSWWGVMWWCVVLCMVQRGVVARGPLRVMRGVLVCGTPHGSACCVGVWPPSWWGCAVLCCVVLRCSVLCCVALRCVVWWSVAPLMVGCAALVCDPAHGRACRVGVRCVVLFGVVCCGRVWPPSWWGVVWWCVAPLMVGLCSVVLCCAALRCVVLCCVALCGVVVVCVPPHGGACCFGVWPPCTVGRAVLGCGVLCCVDCVFWWCVPPRMLGLAALVCGPPHGGAWCVVLCRVALRCVVLCSVALCGVVLVCVPAHGGACCVGFWPPA